MGAWDDLDAELGFKPKPAARVSSPPPKTVGAWDDLDAELSKPPQPRQVSGFGAFADDAIGAVKAIPGALSDAATNAGNKATAAVVGAATKMVYPLIGLDRAQAESVAANLNSATEATDITKPGKPVDQAGLVKWANEYDATRQSLRDKFPVESRLGATDEQLDKLAADIVTSKQKPQLQQEISEITPGSKVYKSPSNTTLHDVGANVGPMVRAASGKAAVGLLAAGAKKSDDEPMFDQAMRAYNMADDETKAIGMQFGDETANARIFGAATSVAQNILPMMAAAITKNPGYAIAPLTLQVAGDRTGEMLTKGYSADDAIAHGVMFGLAEGIPERLSLGMFFKVLGPQKGAKQAAIALAEAYGTEIATENVTELTQFIIEKYSDKPELTLADLGKRLKETTIQTAIAAPVLIGGGIAAHKVGEAMQRGSAENRADDARKSAMSKLDTLQPKAQPTTAKPTGIWDDLDAELVGATQQPSPNNQGEVPASQVLGQAEPEVSLPHAVVDDARNTNSVVNSEAPTGTTQATDAWGDIDAELAAAQHQPQDAIPASELLDETITSESAQTAQNLPPSQSAKQVESAAPSAIERYQWNANKEGGQAYGNQQIIQPLTKELFDQYVADKSTYPSFEDFAADHPGQSIGLISQDNGATWKPGLPFLGTQEELRPKPKNPAWVKQVDSFDSPAAVNHGATADSQTAQPQAQSPAAQQEAQAPGFAGAMPTAKKAKPTPKARELNSDEFGQVARKRFLKSIKESGGVTLAEAKDITGEAGGRANRLLPGLFARTGNGLDRIAEHLHERGYLSDEEYNDVDGGVQRVRDLIRTALDKQMVGTVGEHDEFARLERAERVAEDAKQEAKSDAITDALDGDDFGMGGTPMSEADALELFGFNEGKINDTIAAGKNQGDAAGTVAEGQAGRDFVGTVPPENEAGARGEASEGRSENRQGTEGAGQAEVAPELSSYTNRDILDREAKAERARKDAETKAKQESAPPSSEFTLTGTDRLTTIAAVNRGEITAEDVVESHGVPDDRDHFTLERLNRETNEMESVTFERGEYVRYTLSGKDTFGEIDGISHARREFGVGGLWYPFGFAYKAEKPADVEKPTVPLSDVIAASNKKHGADLDYADRIHTLNVHYDLFKRVHEGDVTADEFKASFESILSNKAGITAELTAMTKDVIFKRFPGLEYRYKNEKKSDVISAAYSRMITDFVLGESFSHGMGKNAFIDGVRAVVARETDETLAKHAADVKQAKEDRAAERDEIMAGLENPETLEDFGRLMHVKRSENSGMTFQEARMTLTPEQRAKFDDLAAEKTRGERANRREAQKDSFIRAPGETVATTEIIKTKHTKHGHDLWQFAMQERVSPEEFKSLVAQARRLGGDYSSYRGNGAIPGWQFRTEEAAKAFKALVAGDATAAKEVAQTRRDAYADDRSQTAVERLTEMADALEEKADASLNQDRKANTERRARFAASAEASANSDKALAKTMRNIANAIESGKAKMLDRVRQKAQVEMLQGFVRTAKGDMLRALYPSYSEQEKHFGEAATTETADYATFPAYTAFRSDLAGLGRALLEVDGTKKLGQQIMKVADDVSAAYLKFAKENLDKVDVFRTKEGGRAALPSKAAAEAAIEHSNYKGMAIVLPFKRNENLIILSPSEAMKRGIWEGDGDKRITFNAEFGALLVEKIGKAARRGNKISVPWQFENTYEKLKRLSGMGIETPAELRAALREFIGLREVAEQPSKIKQLERAMVGRKNDGFDFFPTPVSVADEMIEAAGIEEGMSVLEPSAGMGHIAERIREAGAEPDVVEIASDRRELLEAKGFNLVGSDFMDINPREFFTYGDTFLTPEGVEGVMRGLGGMGSNRVRIVVDGDERTAIYENREDLTPVKKNGYNSGYDRIIMNPPFSDGRAALHVQHAYELLKPGGRLVALMDEGVFYRSDKKTQAFRDWMDSVGATDEKLEEGTFLDPSLPVNTGVNARMVVIDKPTSGDTAALSLARLENFSPLSIGIAEATVTRIGAVFSKKGWDVDLQLAPTFDALPDEVKAAVAEYGEDTKVKGVVHKGVAYVVADEHGSEADLETTILHEVTGHVGVRRLYGKAITARLNDLYLAIGGRKGLSKIAAERGLTADLTEYAKMLGESEFSDEMRTRIMLEEVLAHIAQAPKFTDRVKSVIGAIRAWLRENGFAKLAEYGETDLLHIVSQGRAALATVETDAGPAVLMVEANVSVTAKFARRLSPFDVKTTHDYIVPETNEFDGNDTGDLAIFPADVIGAEPLPIRLTVGEVFGSHRGFGLMRLRDNAARDMRRQPPRSTDDEAENFARDVANVARDGRNLYQDGKRLVLRSPSMRKAIVLELVDRGDGPYYSVVSLVPSENNVWGDSVWSGRLAFPETSRSNSEPSSQADGQSGATSTPERARVQSEQFKFGTEPAKNQATVKIKKRRTYTVSDISKMSRGDVSDGGMTLRDLEAHIANLTRGYKNLPTIVPLQRVSDAPAEVQDAVDQGQARNDVEGMYFNGKIYLFADHLDAARAEHVLINHELAHYGMRGTYGSALDPVLHSIWANNLKVQARATALKTKFGIKDNITATEEVLVDMPESELVKLKGWDKLVFAVRDWLRGHGFTAMADAIDKGLNKKLGQEAKADIEVARIVRAARAYAKDGKATRNPLGGVRFGKDGTWRDVVAAWNALGSDIAAYQNPTPDSFDMESAAREIDSGMQVIEDKPDLDEQRDMKLARKWSVKMPDGTMASIYENEQGEVWLNAANLAEGMSGGTKLYLLVGSYAEANGKVFIGDPAGLSDVALLRRTENMLSLALRFGRTDFMMPHEYQMNPEAKLDTVLKDVARPIEWVVGDNENNLAELLKTSYANTVNLYPGIKNVTFNFDKQRFEQDGREFTDFDGLADRGIGAIRQRGLAKIISSRKPGGTQGKTKDFSPIGSATLKRAAITNTVSRAARSGAGGDVLARISGLVSGGLNSTPLRKVLYSRQNQLPISTSQPPAPPTRQTPLGLQGGSSSNTPTWDAPISTGLDDIAYKLQNKNIDLKRVIESIKEAGRTIQDKFDPYLQEELFHKRAAKRTEDFVDRELNPLLKSAALRDLTLDEIDQYLHARHAEEANALIAERNPDISDGGSGMATADARAYLSGLSATKRANLEAIAAMVDAMISTTRNLYASYGLESANTVRGWADMFDHYVPLMREDHDGGMGIGQGFSIKGREVKHRTGSTAAVVDILANIAMQREKVIVRGEKNRVAVALVGLAKLNPNQGFWEVGKIPTEQVLNEKTGQVETRIDPMFKSRENAIVAKIADGKGGVQEIAVVFNEHNERAMRLAAAMKNLDAARLEGALGVSAKITRYFASINTQYNPVFGVVNLIRDYQGAVLNLSGTPLAKHKAEVMNPLTVMSALKGIYLDTRAERKGGMAMSKWAQLWEEFNLEGGTTGYRDLFRTSADRANAIKRTLDPTKWMESGLGKLFTAGGALKVPMSYAQKKAGWLFDWLSDYNLAMENAVRLSAYKAALDQGLSKQRAASLAKNLTVNFNRKGQLGQQAGALYAFFNASMQGTARIAETVLTMDKGNIKTLRLSKSGAVIVGGGVMLGAMQALMLAAAGFDDDEPPEFVRERSLIIPIGGKKYVTIPMPLGYHVLPNLGRVPTELMLRGGRDAGDHAINLIGTIIEAFNPTGSAGLSWQTLMPTPLDPAMALTENKDWTGKPIARQSFNKATPGHKLAKDTATHPARWISEAINYLTGGDQYTRGKFSPTPDQIDYLGAQLGGGVLRELGKAEQTVSSMFTGEELPPHKIPLAGRFYGDADGSSSQGSAFHKNIERLNEIEAEIKGRRQDGVLTKDYIDKNPEARLIAAANSAERQVSELRKTKRQLIEKDAPRERVKLVEDRITLIMKELNMRVSEARQ